MVLDEALRTEISSLSILELEELHQLVRDIIRKQKKVEAVQTIRSIAIEAGIDLAELAGAETEMSRHEGAQTAARARGTKKYVHPHNPDLVWNGRGRHPLWFKQLIRNGVSPEKLLSKN